MRRYIISVAIVVFLAVVVVFLYRHYSPHQLCLRYYEKEATASGQSREVAEQYAEGLCKAKNPLRN